MTLPTFQLKSATTQTNAPFCHGQAFERGTVPAGSQVVADIAAFQCTPKSTWPDGSLQFAEVAGLADLTANVERTIALSIGTPTGGTNVATGTLSSVTAAVSTLTFGSASWATSGWNSPFAVCSAGPVMSSWHYRKQIGADPHLVAWLEVRAWSTGAVEVLPWVENGFIRVTGPTNKSDTYYFTLGGTQRFSGAVDLKHHARQVLINGAALSYWAGTDPAVGYKHDTVYLQRTELVPFYSATPTQSNIDALVSTYSPNSPGNIVYDGDSMPSPGYQRPIGMLPNSDAVHLMAPSYASSATVVRNGFVAGRYSNHYRDENTNRPLRFSDYPNLVVSDYQGFQNNGSSTTGDMTIAATGGYNSKWDTAHAPGLAYLAYLTTARRYFMEELQFIATGNYLMNGDNNVLRDGVKGLFQPCIGAFNTRASAWTLRALAHALVATPDADTALKTEFTNSMKANIDCFYNRFVAQPNNPFGFVTQDAGGYVGSALPPWMQDFFTAVIGWSLCLGMPISSTYQKKLYDFFHWTAQSVIGRLGAPGVPGFPFMNADIYILSISGSDNPDYVSGAGPWRASWAEVWSVAATVLAGNSSPTSWITTNPTTLAGEIMPGANALWGNLLPAIAYAERHGVAGAAAARSRITGAANFPALSADLNNSPVWAVAPSGITTNLSGGAVSGTPGPHAAFASTPPRGAGRGVFGKRHTKGERIGSLPVGGTNALSPLTAIVEVTDNPEIELRLHYASKAAGMLTDGLSGYTSPVGATSYQIFRGGEPAPIGSATDTITASGSSTITGVTISPLAATINAGGTQQFVGTASGTGSFDPTINYTVTGVAGATGGSINSSGLMTTTSLTTDRVFNVTATSAQDSSKSATTTITVQGVIGVIIAPRFARPVSDVSAGAWVPSTGTSLYAMIDEVTPDATDYIAATTPTTCRIKLGAVTDPNTSSNQVVRYQAWSPTGGSLTARLFCGSTQIASWTHLSLPTTPSLIAQVLTGSQCDAITDYTNLFVEFTAA